ncbi:MAG: hypothetical protein FJ027_03475 [Candidatus Rokubacteria bacterium]|nr:hypothetical protein [Candidatus Rokubacteria bacterium]
MSRLRVTVVVLALIAAAVTPPAHAADRTDIPLKNWGGFSLYRDAVYDDLERLVASGLGDRAVLNTKPISRHAAARLVAHAIEKIRRDSSGVYNNRPDLEPVVDRLIKEFRTELAALGVKIPGGDVPAPSWFSFTPLDRAQARFGMTTRDFRLENRQGLAFQRGVNAGTTFETRAQLGDYVSFYLQPELHGNEEYGAARLAQGYVKLTLFNVELVAGRESLGWGPGYHGSLIMSNNAPPLDHVRIGSAEPFRLPLIGDWIGPTKILAFMAQLEARRDIPRTKLGGLRASIAPFEFLELGASYVNQFGGDTPPRLRGLGDHLRLFVDPEASDQDDVSPRFRNNVLFALDGELRFSNVDRFYLPMRDVRIYGEFGWDDTCCSTAYIPFRPAISWLFGVHGIGLLGDDTIEGRFEMASTSELSFVHNQFTRGYWTRGFPIAHYIGTDGFDTFTRITKRFDDALMVGVGMRIGEIGDTLLENAGRPRERRYGGSLDVTYKLTEAWSVFGQADVMRATNRNFVAGDDGWDAVVFLEVTRAFR